jgi:hypothetical protein
MPIILDGTQGITFPDNSRQYNGYFGFKNRIINGDMRIDQRNAGASVTPANGTFSVDRWAAEISQASKFSFQQNAGSVTPPAGFTNYLGVTSLSAYTVGAGEVFNLYQRIEGLNISDLAWGTASAQTITVSFWVRSSLTGTFGGAIQNNGNDRSYPFAFTISAANTWEQKSVTIPGDTSGTWLTTNGIGMRVRFSLGAGSTVSGTAGAWAAGDFRSVTGATSVVGTNGATFYITGVQLEEGVVSTNFDVLPYTTQLQLCQRYYFRFNASESNWLGGAGYSGTTTTARVPITFPVQMRIPPTAIDTTGTASNYRVLPANVALSVVPALNLANQTDGWLSLTVASGLTGNAVAILSANSGVSTAFIGWSAEL